MSHPRRSPTFTVRFDDVLFDGSLTHATAAGRQVLQTARRELERAGIAADQLRPCRANHRDGTDLAGMVKLYLPAPIGPWGLVLRLADDQDRAYLMFVAFGSRHPQRRPSVYDIAHHNRHGTWPHGM